MEPSALNAPHGMGAGSAPYCGERVLRFGFWIGLFIIEF
jgi:hypothetical protein